MQRRLDLVDKCWVIVCSKMRKYLDAEGFFDEC
jgi:hypothetical protein